MNNYLFFASAGECADMLISTSCHLLDNSFEIIFDHRGKINTTNNYYTHAKNLGFYRHNWRAINCKNTTCIHEFTKNWFNLYKNILYINHTTKYNEYQRWFLFLAKTIWYNEPDWIPFKKRYKLKKRSQITKEDLIDYVNYRFNNESPIDKESVLKILHEDRTVKIRHYCKINFSNIFNNHKLIINQLEEYFGKKADNYIYDKWEDYLFLNKKLAEKYCINLEEVPDNVISL